LKWDERETGPRQCFLLRFHALHAADTLVGRLKLGLSSGGGLLRLAQTLALGFAADFTLVEWAVACDNPLSVHVLIHKMGCQVLVLKEVGILERMKEK